MPAQIHAGADSGSGPLSGVLVVLTRPAEQIENLAARIRAQGGDVLCSPLIDIRFRFDGEVAQHIARLHTYDAMAVTSANAVRALAAAAQRQHTTLAQANGGRLPVCFAVGPATGRVAADAGFPVVVPDGVKTAADLAQVLQRRLAGSPARLLVPCGQLTDAAIWRTLTADGHQVDVVVCYETMGQDVPVEQWQSRFASAARVVIALTSPSTAQRLAPHASVLLADADVRITAIGPSTARACRSLGLPVAAVADPPSEDGLLQAIIAAAARV